jgi:predicted PurR-regulated permease PerM
VVQILDATVITPKILGGKLGLRPLWIIVALMAGGELFGFLGMLLAVPTAAVLKILVLYTVDRYKSSSLFLDGVAPDDPTGGSAVAPDASEGDHEGAGPVS